MLDSPIKLKNRLLKKDDISILKNENIRFIYDLLGNSNSRNMIATLKYLGKLPKNFDGTHLLPLLFNNDHRVRYLAVKNLGKLKDERYLPTIITRAKMENDSIVRREMVSAVGRMRSPQAIDFLIKMTEDDDPKIVLQAIRALLYFKNDPKVENRLKRLSLHPNEMIQEIIKKEYDEDNSKSENKSKGNSVPDFLRNIVLSSNVKQALKYIPDESVHLTFTSPPYYNARDYSFYKSYKEYLQFLSEVFHEVKRITKEGRFFVLNTSPIIIPRVSRQHASKRYPIPFDIHHYLVQDGWEFIDDIVWVKPETSAKNRVAGFDQHRKPLAYKPNPITEYLMVYRKNTNRLIDWNIRQYSAEVTEASKVKGEYDTANVWHIDPVFDKVHSAVFPLELCKRVIKYYSFKGDLVFDPFAGSGTFGKAALMMERCFLMTEVSNDYIKRIKENLKSFVMLSKPQIKFLNIATFMKEAANEARTSSNS